jgi:prephenate dehydrogenase
VREAQVVLPAVPVAALAGVLRDLRPVLRPGQLLLEVSSVKRGPVAALTEILGGDRTWVANHPLFGPSSIALGERPLTVVVCPGDLHAGAVRRAREFWEQLGCRVIEQTADEHDAVMARTHALAFFVAKGMIDLGAEAPPPFTPPSFQAMARTIESVRSDAAHLFRTIQTDNPYAADARARLLDILEGVHRDLVVGSDGASGGPGASAGPPAIPDLGSRAPELRETRDLIDDVDRELLRLLARRSQLSRRAGRVKARAGEPIRDANREVALLGDRRRWAAEEGLDPAAVHDLFEAVLKLSREVQRRDPARAPGDPPPSPSETSGP